LSLGWLWLLFINIHDVPLLVDTVMLVPDNDLSVLMIVSTVNINNLALFIDEKAILVLEHLPPPRVRCSSLHVAVVSIVMNG
jgi:hypothetical protein